MFSVFDNNKPAVSSSLKVAHKAANSPWKNNTFASFEEALTYAKHWLGEYATTLPDNWKGEKHDYSGYGDVIEIRNN